MLKQWLMPFTEIGFQNSEFRPQVHMDSGKEFVNKLSEELFQLLNVNHTKNSPAHPQCNAHVEVFNKTVKKFLQSFVARHYLELGNFLTGAGY
jgi:hypothetical protein